MPILNLADEKEVTCFNQFVENAKFTSIMQDLAWRNVKNNWEHFAVFIEEEGAIVAAMSILLIKNVGEKKFAYVSKGPVMNQPNVSLVKRLVLEAEAELLRRNVFLLRMDPEWLFTQELAQNLRAENFIVRNRDFDGHAFIQPRLSMVVPIAGQTQAEMLASFYGKTRYRINYALKNGATPRLSSNRTDLAIFYKLYAATGQRHHITYRPQEYFARLADNFLQRGIMKIAVVDLFNQADAAGLMFAYGNRVWYMYAGSTHQNQKYMTSYLLNWIGIKWAIDLGLEYYDLGGIFAADHSDSLFTFKNMFVRPNMPVEYIGEIDQVYDEEAYQKFLTM